MKLLITGSRNYNNYDALKSTIDELTIILQLEEDMDNAPTEILHGGAKGADQLADRYAKEYKIPCTVIRPDYQNHHPKAAPLLRNSELVKLADCTLALYGPKRTGKGGTADAAKKTKAARKHLLERAEDGTTKHTPPAPRQTALW